MADAILQRSNEGPFHAPGSVAVQSRHLLIMEREKRGNNPLLWLNVMRSLRLSRGTFGTWRIQSIPSASGEAACGME